MTAPHITRRMLLGGLGSLGWPALATPALQAASGPCVWELPGSWEDDQGGHVAMAEWRGRPALLTLAYGACRRICSTSLRLLQEAQQDADARNLALSVIVVSLDPRVDTPAAWREFRSEHRLQRPNWHFLAGTAAQTHRIAELLEMKYWVYDDHVLHDLRIAAVNASGHIVARIDWVDEPARRLVDALAA